MVVSGTCDRAKMDACLNAFLGRREGWRDALGESDRGVEVACGVLMANHPGDSDSQIKVLCWMTGRTLCDMSATRKRWRESEPSEWWMERRALTKVYERALCDWGFALTELRMLVDAMGMPNADEVVIRTIKSSRGNSDAGAIRSVLRSFARKDDVFCNMWITARVLNKMADCDSGIRSIFLDWLGFRNQRELGGILMRRPWSSDCEGRELRAIRAAQDRFLAR